jgi:cbb3-type cytochrome oxidase subunit 3
MALWIFLIALIYIVSWTWLFSRVGKHTVDVQQQRQPAACEEAM